MELKTEDLTSTQEIQSVLERGWVDLYGAAAKILAIDRCPYAYRSSYPLEQIDLQLADRRQLSILFKNMSPNSIPHEIRDVRCNKLYNPCREILVYDHLLAVCPQRTAICYGTRIDHNSNQYWLFVERFLGKELYQYGELQVWLAAARWLARFHAFRWTDKWRIAQSQLRTWDRSALEQVFEMAIRVQQSSPIAENRDRFVRLSEISRTHLEPLLSQPAGVIHGEFFASNVLVRSAADNLEVCPIDWETAAIGPVLLDLAALVAGNWTGMLRAEIVQAYWLEMDELGSNPFPSRAAFDENLLSCRFQLALQMLARPLAWQPPAEHRHDWLGEAELLVAELKSLW